MEKELVLQKFDEVGSKIKELEAKNATIEEMKGELGNLATEFAELKGQYDGMSKGLDTLGKAVQQGLDPAQRPQDFKGLLVKSLEEGLKGKSFSHQSERTDFEVKNATVMLQSAMDGGKEGFNRTYQSEIVRNPFVQTHVRSLIPSAALTTEILQYPKLVAQAGGAAIQTEGNTKAQVSYTFDTVIESPVTLASFAVVSKQMLSAMPQLAAFIQTQMTEDLLNKEDDALLNGPGGSNQINGIYTQAGLYAPSTGSQAAGANADSWNYLIDAISQLAQVNYQPNGILVNPKVFYEMFQVKAVDGKYNVPYAGVTVGETGIRILGVPVIQTTTAALANDEFIVGDWTRANKLDREGLSIDISFEDSDNFRKNLVTLRIEERFGLAVYHPAAFLKGSIPAVGA